MKKLFAFSLCLFCALPLPLYSQGDGPRELFSKAHQLFSQGSLAEAEEPFLKTLDHGFLLEDYSLYFLGAISFSRGNLEGSRAYFSRLKQSFSQSVWSVHADLQLARISLAEKDYQRAAEALRSLRSGAAKKEISNEALYLLAQAYQGQGELSRSHSLFQELRKLSPLSPWAAKAREEVNRLREEQPQLFGLTTPQALADEGELLLSEREHQQAERAYRKLLDLVPRGSLRPRSLMGLANAYVASRKRQDAIPILAEIVSEYPESPEAPSALHRLAWIHWNRDENLTALDHFNQLKGRYPQSAYVDYAHFASARIYESLGRAEEALEIYRDFPKRFPGSPLREEAQWRLAWIHYLRGNHRRARAAFMALAEDKAGERYKAAALYWQARSAEKMGQAEEAKRIYLRILNGDDESYYTGPAARALEKMGQTVEERKAEDPKPLPEAAPLLGPHRSFHLSRAQELAQISLSHLAVGELDEIKMPGSDDLPLRLMLMREYARNNAYGRSVALANQIRHPSDDLKRHRYPLAYWEMIRKLAKERDLDPYLVVGLVRQESLFDPKALSPASAFGLMQLLPSTAARAAAQLGLPQSQPEKLFGPDLNLALGTHYLKELLQRYSDNAVKAIAAYNAGENAVARWEKQILAEDEEEFIERIPYGETRLYVKLVLRNHRIYQRLYPDPKKEPRQE